MAPHVQEDQNCTSQSGDFDNIPIIDLSSLNSPRIEERQKLAQKVYDACTRVGFFYVKNHGIPEDMINVVHRKSRQFFALPEERKMDIYIGKSQKYRGYTPLYAEKSTGVDDDPDSSPDNSVGSLSEAFDIGYETAMDVQKPIGSALPPDTYGMYGDNQWPGEDVIPGFRESYLQYCSRALELCRRLMSTFALALDLPEGYFDTAIENPGASARLMHYPAQPVKGEVLEGLGAHTDYECLTILAQGDVPGLQVLNRRGEWVLATPIPGTLVVNVGDCFSIWTNKKFKSTIHRVTNLTGKERYTIPFFFGVNYDTMVSVLENYITPDNPACREPFKAGEYVLEKLSRAYVGYGG